MKFNNSSKNSQSLQPSNDLLLSNRMFQVGFLVMNKLRITGLSLQILNEEKSLVWNENLQAELIITNQSDGIIMSENEDFEELDEEEEEIGEDDPSIQDKTPQEVTPLSERITLFFRSTIGPGEKLEKLLVDIDMPVRELAETIGNIFALDPQDFHLSISGRTLDRDDILSNYEIEDGLEVLVIPVSTAG